MNFYVLAFLGYAVSASSIEEDSYNENAILRSLPELVVGQECVPGLIYKVDCNSCLCSSTKNLICSKMACVSDIFKQWLNQKTKLRKLKRLKLPSYPFLPSIYSQCVPQQKYRVECNLCKCLENKSLQCTHHYCYGYDDIHTKNALELAGRRCHKWESINYNCVQCHCDKSKLVCEVIAGCSTKDEDLEGRHIKDGSKKKCVENATYRLHCNQCLCEGGNLKCTAKLCKTWDEKQPMDVTYSDAQDLKLNLIDSSGGKNFDFDEDSYNYY